MNYESHRNTALKFYDMLSYIEKKKKSFSRDFFVVDRSATLNLVIRSIFLFVCLFTYLFILSIHLFVFSNRVVVVLFIYFYFRRFVYMFTLLYICLFVYFSFPVNFRSSTCLFLFLLSIISLWLFFNLLVFYLSLFS